MDKFALLALLHARPGKEKELEEFLKSAQPLAVAEPGHHDLVRRQAGA